MIEFNLKKWRPFSNQLLPLQRKEMKDDLSFIVYFIFQKFSQRQHD